jgi:16S rRNA (uracil1498-N3)-methyltransferase
VTHKQVVGVVTALLEPPPSTTVNVSSAPILCCALLKEQAWDAVLQAAAELGVSEVQPVLTEHSQSLQGDRGKKQQRWQDILLRASLQCERLSLPLLNAPRPLQEVVATVAQAEKSVGSHPRVSLVLVERLQGLASLLPTLQSHATVQPVLFVGPEGGWTSEEVAYLQNVGVTACHLGESILKAETAVTVALGAWRLIHANA